MLPEQELFLARLFQTSFENLILYSIAVLRDEDIAKDAVQDTFHEAILHIETLVEHENPGGWLMQTLKNKIREYNRARRRYIHHFLSLDSDLTIELVSQDTSSVRLLELNHSLTLEKIRQALTPQEMHLLERLIFDNASHLTVAKELGITVWNSQKRLQRIREKLKKLFPEWKKKK